MSADRAPKQELMKSILDVASRDRRFRSSLLENPKAAIFERFGVQIPEYFAIRFIERAADLDALVVLPPLEVQPEDELSDADLEIVVGGARPDPDLPDIRGLDFRWSQ